MTVSGRQLSVLFLLAIAAQTFITAACLKLLKAYFALEAAGIFFYDWDF